MSAKAIGYWATTSFVALELLAGGLTDLVHGRQALVAGPPVVSVITQLGYPVYVLTILGAWKLLGAVALLVPRFPRLKEWAYAGTFFEMTGAAISLGASGAAIGTVSFPLLVAALALASWALRPPDRTIGVLSPATRSKAGASARLARAHLNNEVEA
ncbi:MAG TPA: DoxX family protein [Ktedonobacterales bacterium]